MDDIYLLTGECEGKDVFKCPNDRCVASGYTCSDYVNACGTDRSHCDVLKELQKLLELIVKTIKNYIWVVALIFALCILKAIYKRKREAICGLKKSVWSRFITRSRNSNSTVSLIRFEVKNKEYIMQHNSVLRVTIMRYGIYIL